MEDGSRITGTPVAIDALIDSRDEGGTARDQATETMEDGVPPRSTETSKSICSGVLARLASLS
jgi:hypothetical protein